MSRLGLADGWGLIQRLRFNHEKTIFTVAAKDGLRIFRVDPIHEYFHFKTDRVGSLEIAELFEESNILAMVAMSPSATDPAVRPKFDDKSVIIFDPFQEEDEQSKPKDHASEERSKPRTKKQRGRFLWEFTMTEKVLAVRMTEDKFMAVCKNQIHVFSFQGKCKFLYSVRTRENPKGLCEAGPLETESKKSEIVVFPGYTRGSVQIVDLSATEKTVSQSPIIINTHKSDLYCLGLNQKGTIVATASSKGTLIRIWDTITKQMLVELRRGTDQALLHCITFSSDDEWLCCSSDKGTVHIFALQDYKLNKRSALATIGVPLAYAGSQWSLASFTVPQECACICCFGDKPGTVFAACIDGSFHKYNFTPDGQCNQIQYDVFTQMCEDCIWEDMRK